MSDQETLTGDVKDTEVGHCKANRTDTYIGRGPGGRDMSDTPVGERGWLGNPFVTNEKGGEYTLDESIERFFKEFHARLAVDEEFREAVHELAGDTLGGWCQLVHEDGPACHGDVIAKYLNDPDEWVSDDE